MGKIRLRVLEIGVADSYADNYILILGEYGGSRRLPIVIPLMEAQAIAVQFEQINPARPLIHDLFFNAVSSFGVELLEVNITAFENGIFSSEILLFDGKKQIALSARTSDAIALALRFRCSIFATPNVMELAGVSIDDGAENTEPAPESNHTSYSDFKLFSIQELERLLDEFVRNEEYERATAVRDELRRRKNENS